MGRDSPHSATPLLPAYSSSSSSSFSPPPPLPSAPLAPPPYNPDGDVFDVPPELEQDVRSVRAELERLGIKAQHQARVCLVLDISRSMQNPNQFYFNTQTRQLGPIYDLLLKALSTALVIDDDQQLEIFPFGTTARAEPYIATKDNFQSVISNEILQGNPAATMQEYTNYAAAMRAVRQKYFPDEKKNSSSATPVFMIFVTDGDHNRELPEAAAQFRASSFQPIFCKIIALRGQTNPDFSFLQNLDDAPTLDDPKGRPLAQCNYIDNVDFVLLNNPSELTITKLFNEYPQWLLQAQQPRYGHTLLTVDQRLDNDRVRRLQAQADRVGEQRDNGCCIL